MHEEHVEEFESYIPKSSYLIKNLPPGVKLIVSRQDGGLGRLGRLVQRCTMRQTHGMQFVPNA